MRISTLKLNGFRNFISEEFNFSDSINVIHGSNAQGKTNLLESVFLCSCGRSDRTAKDEELINFSADGYGVILESESENRSTSVEIYLRRGQRKKISINGIPVKRLGELLGAVKIVMFSPEDLAIVKGAPSERRRFIDIALSQYKPSYFFELQRYARSLKQRNTLLKKIKDEGTSTALLEVWNETLADSGSRIIRERFSATGKISGYALKRHSGITGGKEEITLSYMPSIKGGAEKAEDKTREEIKEMMLNGMEKNQEREVFYGTTLTGPHRDDWSISIKDREVRDYGSQGQQRTVVLSLKLAVLDLLEQETGEKPVLLLDDVMSELDAKRRQYLAGALEGIQALITTTEKESIAGEINKKINYIEIRNGKRVLG